MIEIENLPSVEKAFRAQVSPGRLFIAAHGFEPRSLGWAGFQENNSGILDDARIVSYKNPKGTNLVKELNALLSNLGSSNFAIKELPYDTKSPHEAEDIMLEALEDQNDFVEIVVDISAMTKLLILATLNALRGFKGILRLAYTTQKPYLPSQSVYERSKKNMKLVSTYPSRGVGSIVRARFLSSTKMQGQPVTLVAFTSFNEQLIRHMLGTITPHRLILVNGIPNNHEDKWRELAMQEINQGLIKEYPADNELDKTGRLKNKSSLIDYRDTIKVLDKLHNKHGVFERIICVASGSKMQTVGLFFAKQMHPDIHIEYPTPNSYLVDREHSQRGEVYEVVFNNFAELISKTQ
ncbi:MAG: hypothetical protein KIT46_00215 [Anaerolineales bacterium]|nr:hypothetical protein [Anaerolineales bacterium]MCW5854445.1 hypothetical protein [Anaerolineales bacterium]